MKDYAIVGSCAVCGQGRLIVAKECSTGCLYVLCEECESEWESPVDCQKVELATHDERGRSELLEREDVMAHPWNRLLGQ